MSHRMGGKIFKTCMWLKKCVFRKYKVFSKLCNKKQFDFRNGQLRSETVKLLEETIGSLLFDIYHSKIFFYPPPTVMEKNPKVNKWDLIQLKTYAQQRKQ